MAEIRVGYPAVYHDPNTGEDRPAVVSGKCKTGSGRDSMSKFDIIVFDTPSNVKIAACNKGEETGEFEIL